MSNPNTPTAPDGGAGDKPDITGGDIEIMRRSVDAKRARVLEGAQRAIDNAPYRRPYDELVEEVARLSAALAGQTAYSDEVRNQRDYYAHLVSEAGDIVPALVNGLDEYWQTQGHGYEAVKAASAWIAKAAIPAWARDDGGKGGDSNE